MPIRLPDFGSRSTKTVSALAAIIVALATVWGMTWSRVRQLESTVSELERAVVNLEETFGILDDEGAEGASVVSPLLFEYQLEVPGRGEVFPAMATSGAPEYWPVAVLTVTNSANRPVMQTIMAEIPGWSQRMEQSLVVGPRETEQLQIRPALLPRAIENDEIRHAVLDVRATSRDGNALYSESRPVLIHGGSEIYWGRQFANAQSVARWVTPHDSLVLDLVSRARRHIPRGRMAGYSRATGDDRAVTRHVTAQARAIFRALQGSGLSYVSSIFVMGDYVGQAQRIRLPRETLRLENANCMDVSVVFASAVENLGMQPLLVIVPGHALVGVRLGRDSPDVLYLDLTVLPNGSFDSAVARARRYLNTTPAEGELVVDVMAARVLGVYPL